MSGGLSFVGLAWRSIRHDPRSSLGIVAGVAVTAAVLVGALAVGDSVRATLRARAEARIGKVDAALECGERFVRDAELVLALEQALARDGREVAAAAVLRLPGFAGSGRVRSTAIVECLGVDGAFFALAPDASDLDGATPKPGEVWVSEILARRLDLEADGGEVLLRIEKSTPLPRDSALSTIDDVSFALRAKVTRILGDDEFGGFGLRAAGVPPSCAVLDRGFVQEQLELAGRANLLLVQDRGTPRLEPGELASRLQRALPEAWTAHDLQLDTVPTRRAGRVEIRTDRIFLQDPVVDAIRALVAEPVDGADGGPAVAVYTWFVNGLTRGERTTPYSTVSAVGPLVPEAPGAFDDPLAGVVEGVPDDGIVLDRWTADDLQAGVGDRVRLDYYVMGARQQLVEESRELEVARVVPMDGPAVDDTLMPPFPGLSGSDSCQDWEPGIPVELDRIRDVDEEYWDLYDGAPKAFVPLVTGRAMWSGAQGSTTGVRLGEAAAARVLEQLPGKVDPALLGLAFRDVRTPALAAGSAATDFGGLFLGLSVFLIASALILTSLLFAFTVERRAPQVGVLLATGFRPRQVRRLLLIEAGILAAAGAVVGAGLGLGYTALVLEGLQSGWRGALGYTSSVAYAPSGASVVGGAVGAMGTALLAILGATARPVRAPVVELLRSRGGIPAGARTTRRLRIAPAVAVVGFVAAVVLVAVAPSGRSQAAAGAFFGAGALLLVALLAASRWLLAALDSGRAASVGALGLRNAARRPGRSVATVALLASGMFLVVSVQSFRLAPPPDPAVRDTGTGGFTLWARTVLPVLRDPDTQEGRAAYGLDTETFLGVDFVPMQVVQGDDASCLNLGSPQNPRLLGVEPDELAARGAFGFVSSVTPDGAPLEEGRSPWELLEADYGDGVVPAIGDMASILWTLHKSVGDRLEYLDDQGRRFDVKLVAATSDSLLQGSLVVADRHVEERFSSAVGFREFFVDAPPARAKQVRDALSDAFADVGMEVWRSEDRLRAFQAVQNTYLVIFQALGLLGLLLGSVGLGLVVLRNVLERRSELATLFAVGYAPGRIRWLIWSEHGLLLGLGLAGGALSAALAVLPGAASGSGLAWRSLATLVGVIGVSGLVWVTLATRVAAAPRGTVVQALRDE